MTLKIKNFALYNLFHKKRRFAKKHLALSILIAIITLSVSTNADNKSKTIKFNTDKTVTEVGGLSKSRWGEYSTVVVGNKVVMGRSYSDGYRRK